MFDVKSAENAFLQYTFGMQNCVDVNCDKGINFADTRSQKNARFCTMPWLTFCLSSKICSSVFFLTSLRLRLQFKSKFSRSSFR